MSDELPLRWVIRWASDEPERRKRPWPEIVISRMWMYNKHFLLNMYIGLRNCLLTNNCWSRNLWKKTFNLWLSINRWKFVNFEISNSKEYGVSEASWSWSIWKWSTKYPQCSEESWAVQILNSLADSRSVESLRVWNSEGECASKVLEGADVVGLLNRLNTNLIRLEQPRNWR